MTEGEFEQRAIRLSAGIAQSGLTDADAVVIAWPRNSDGYFEVTIQKPKGVRELVLATKNVADALLRAEELVLEESIPEEERESESASC